MVVFENECVGCDYCIGSACGKRNVPHYYCDECGAEETLYDCDGEELCSSCLPSKFEKVKGSEI